MGIKNIYKAYKQEVKESESGDIWLPQDVEYQIRWDERIDTLKEFVSRIEEECPEVLEVEDGN